MNSEQLDQDRQRDAASLQMIGTFFTVLAVLVLSGTWWALDRRHAMWVNLGAGAILLIIGLAMVFLGRRTARPRRSAPEQER